MAAVPEIAPGYSLPPTQHVCIVGSNGTGKSTFAHTLLRTRPYVIVVDSKPGGAIHWPGFRATKDIADALRSPGQWTWRMTPAEYDESELDATWRHIMMAGRWYVYIDEGHDFTVSSNKAAGINALMYQGRGKGITTWFGSQRSIWVPTFAFSETIHKVCFRLRKRDDREVMADEMVFDGRRSPWYARMMRGPQTPHGFFYANSDTGAIMEFSDIKQPPMVEPEPARGAPMGDVPGMERRFQVM